MFKCITLILKDCLCYHRRQNLFAPKAVKTYFRRQKVADEVQIQQVSELPCCGVVGGFMRRVWRGRFQTQKQKVSNTALLSCLIGSKTKNNTHTKACVTHASLRCWPGSRCDQTAPLWLQSASAETRGTINDKWIRSECRSRSLSSVRSSRDHHVIMWLFPFQTTHPQSCTSPLCLLPWRCHFWQTCTSLVRSC